MSSISAKKMRSKSLSALKSNALSETSENRRNSVVSTTPKSILKTTPRKASSLQSPTVRKSPRHGHAANNQSSEDRSEDEGKGNSDNGLKEQREERRKSLANRRVSFAPEATLHTWDVVEYLQDSTTSSGSPVSTRRSSAYSKASDPESPKGNTSQWHSSLAGGAGRSGIVPNTPPRQRRRRQSGIPANFSSSPGSDLASPQSDTSRQSDNDTVLSSCASEDDPGNESFATVSETTEQAGHGSRLTRNANNLGDPALSEAAHHMGLRETTNIENDDVSMVIAGEDTTGPFNIWVKENVGSGLPLPHKPVTKGAAGNIANIDFPSDDGEMSMEITEAVGCISSSQPVTRTERRQSVRRASKRQSLANQRRSSTGFGVGDLALELVTTIESHQPELGDKEEANNLDENEEMSMEMTAVFGYIKSTDAQHAQTRAQPTLLQPGTPSESSVEGFSGDSVLTPNSRTLSNAVVLESIQLNTSQEGVSSDGQKEVDTAPSTPSKQVLPNVTKAVTPNKTPPSAHVAMRKTSPRKLFKAEMQTNQRAFSFPSDKFGNDERRTSETPDIILAPDMSPYSPRKDQESEITKTRSPQIAALLDRRSSIGESANAFTPQTERLREVRFENPQAMNIDVSRETEEDRRRESGRRLLAEDADDVGEEQDVTTTLRDMIQSMTPRTNNFKGRKSLATGGARGLLGKRPAELDEIDQDGSPRDYGKAQSPVKRIKLIDHPMKSPTKSFLLEKKSGIDRLGTRRSRGEFEDVVLDSPRGQQRTRDMHALPHNRTNEATLSQPTDVSLSISNEILSQNEGKLSMQEFLKLTNIKFMELTTTKRRHTVAPVSEDSKTSETVANGDGSDMLLEESVVAGACTIPMLELYQHACRELKKYITEGRSIVQEIEADTLEETPLLFKQYVMASPQARAQLDIQLKNLKTNARLLSKGTWYEWRSKLLDGLEESLSDISSGMENDYSIINEQRKTMAQYYPSLVEERDQLEKELKGLRDRAKDLSDSDPKQLQDARKYLLSLKDDQREKDKILQDTMKEVAKKNADLETIMSGKLRCQTAIKQAQKQREGCLGWSSRDVVLVQDKVKRLEESSGWRIVYANRSSITLVYRQDIQLYFDLAGFFSDAMSHSSISLTHYERSDEGKGGSDAISTDKRFFLQMLRAHLQTLVQTEISPQDLLVLVTRCWDIALAIHTEIKHLNLLAGVCEARILGDEALDIQCRLLIPETRTKLAVHVRLSCTIQGHDIRIRPSVKAEVVYGEMSALRLEKMNEFLASRIRFDEHIGSGAWALTLKETKARIPKPHQQIASTRIGGLRRD